ncbi:DUF3500 domain-containing protein [Segetibacter aerophilus]|uniref:DUF3500 domain-containing protein n=1 Tax=Segetibacter aerophilus TaxID=670293 RepID=A0A512BA65_9BACT|nr:DUF3500 domain-containing protein [Segetibacter aerophilus]GEO08819.1 hypothetical protein SAE01_13150 [Segetibacter aerophilus]
MKILLIIVSLLLLDSFSTSAQGNDLYKTANVFLNSLDNNQKAQAQYPFDSAERYRWHYVPLNDRKGISINELNAQQKDAAIALVKSALSENAYKKASQIMALETVLKAIENRQESDHYRDPGKYYFTLFGTPSASSVWGWRLDGHHLSFSFSSENNKIVSGTPGFMGANPAIVLSGPEKGLEILKEENELAFEFLKALNAEQLAKAIIETEAPGDIITVNSRKAMIDNTNGIAFSTLTASQKAIFIKLLSLYIHRYTRLFANSMMHDIEAVGMDKLIFAWAGSKENGVGNKRYYRIKGPTIIIEYDNTQNNGNHVHTVVRDLQHDFGGDALLEHYKKSH